MKSNSRRALVLSKESAAMPVAASLLTTGFAIAVLGNAYSTLLGPDRPLSASPLLAFLAIAHLAVGLGFFVAGFVTMSRGLKKAKDRRVWLGGLLASLVFGAIVVLQTFYFWVPTYLTQ